MGNSIRIYIDNYVGDDCESFTKRLKERLFGLRLDIPYEVISFSDLESTSNEYNDPNNEQNTIKAINNADIIIPIVTESFMSYVTSEVEMAYNHTINSTDRYFFPVLLKATDWSNHEWLVKSQIIPRDATPLSELSKNKQEIIINELIQTIQSSIVELSRAQHSESHHGQRNGCKNKLIFISHDHDDADFAELLKLRLEREGVESWLDTEKLKIGQDWRDEIDHGIQESAAIIVIMTPEARKSEYVTYEWAFAWGKGKKVFPIMLKQTQLHPRLESLQYLNFTNKVTRPWDELIDSIKKLLN